MGRLLKWVVAAAVLFFVWKVVVPWVKTEADAVGSSSTAKSVAGGSTSCVASAERASNAWGSGLGQFVNPPYDLDAWSIFQDDVASKIAAAEAACLCDAESCTGVRNAMSDLRDLTGDFDTAIRNGTPPPEEAVQRQERIDGLIDEARAAVQAGK